MRGSNRSRRLAVLGGIIAVACCGISAAAMAHDVVVAWKRQPGTEEYDVAQGVATDASGNVYLTGWTDGSLGGADKGDADAWLVKYDTHGHVVWKRQPGTVESDFANGVATDAAGNVYLTGETYGSLGGAHRGGGDAWVAKYDAHGQLLWTRQLGSVEFDFAWGVATDAAGNVYLTGVTHGSLDGANKGGYDAWVAKYDADGHRLWTRQLGTEETDRAQGVATDAAGNVYLTGETGSDAWVIKFSQATGATGGPTD